MLYFIIKVYYESNYFKIYKLLITLVCIIFVIKGFLTDYKLLFDIEFKSVNHFTQSALVRFYSTFYFFGNIRNFLRKI